MQKTMIKKVLAGLGLFLAGTTIAMAGADSSFNSVVTMLRDWTEGSLGQLFAIGSFTTGLATTIMRGSLMPAVVGVGVAMAAAWGPGILTGMFSATGVVL